MRLIDADELIKDRVENDPVRIAVQCAPTVFDKEKVINEIHISSAGMAVNMNVSSSYAEGYIDAAKDIIEIIEKGGIE
ncbi:MAG TPA: hypothetical protein H9722_01220 [Candidatus Mediterraneibacter pullistercoris]|nr:hypothetical protein [Candidatus Mediterraneibacter pullistercoris]